MKNDKTPIEPRPQQSARHAMVWALVLSSMISTPVLSAPTDISSSPITSTNAAQVKPNIMLLMDTSGSMGWSHMPDEVESQVGFGAAGYKAAQCNVLYYNPNQTYALPKKSDGSPFPTPSFGSSPYDAFQTPASVNVDLSSAFRAYDSATLRFSGDNDTQQKGYYYYKTGGTVPITSYASSPCSDADPAGLLNSSGTFASSDGGVWHRVLVSSSSGVGNTDERTNFAIWYSYYRTRILLIKSAASLAFTPLTDSFRVGFITVRPKDNPDDASINPSKYLPIDDFTPVQRGLWFDKLFSQRPAGSSPTREGLARVGRHYAGMHDGINTGMTGDPVQFSCQQNFTIMTTDGYWNGQEESYNLGGGYLGGPVDITGKALVGQRDGSLNSFSTNNPSPAPAVDVDVTPRPIWDGTFDGLRTIRSRNNVYAYRACGSYFSMTTTTITKSTSQLQKQTVQTRMATTQNLQSTSQIQQTTTQMLKSTRQPMIATTQRLKSTRQALANTAQRIRTTTQQTQTDTQIRVATTQNLRSTTQNLQSTVRTQRVHTHTDESVFIPQQTTTQNLRSTTQTLQSTSQQNQGTTQRLQSTQKNSFTLTYNDKITSQTTSRTTQTFQHTEQQLQSTSQTLRRTAQTLQSSSQASASTLRLQKSTSQIQLTTSQTTKRTTQENRCDSRGENCVPAPAGSCVAGGGVTCETRTTPPTLVAYNGCTDDPASSNNSWRATICNTVTQPAIPAASCSFDPASGSNSYTTTTCFTATSGPTDVASCTNQPANSTNSYTATSCNSFASGPTYVASCVAASANAGNGFVATSCTYDNRGPAGVDTCNQQTGDNTNNYLTVNCVPNNTPDTPVQTCTAPPRSSGNGWVTTVCTPVTTTNVPVASCTTSGPTAGNSWVDTTCTSNNSTEVAVDASTCNATPATNGNGYVATLCRTVTVNSASDTCSPQAADSGNSWVGITCPTVVNTTPFVPYGTCSPSGPSIGNSWTTTTCPQTINGPYPYAALGCFANVIAGPYSYVCTSVVTTDVPVASCSPTSIATSPGYIETTCRTNASALTPVAACLPVAADNTNSYTATICPVVTTTDVPVMSCTANSTPDNSNSYTATSCRQNDTNLVPVASCSNSGPTPGNGYTNTVCSTNNQANVAVDSCTPQSPSLGNGWVTTTCPPEIRFSGPTENPACAPVAASAGNGHHRTDCNVIIDGTPVEAGTCVPDPGNGITCVTTTDPNRPVASCTPQTAAAGNNWIEITCGTNNQLNVPVLSCSPQGPTSGNSWVTTTCPTPITTGPGFAASCAEILPDSGNDFVHTTCPAPVVSGPNGVETCSYIGPTSGNQYTTSTCSTVVDTRPVQTCTDTPAGTGNQWTQTSCADNNSTNQPVAVCNAQAALIGNNWVTTTCPAPIVTTDVPVASCNDDPFPTSFNVYTTTSCRTNAPAPTPSGSCVPVPADNTNSYTATLCPTVTTGPAGDPACSGQIGDGTNQWLTITCVPNNTSGVGVASCSNSGPNAGNGYTNTSCFTATSTDVGVASCSAGGPTPGNGYTTTSCRRIDSDVPSQTCTPDPAGPGNGYRATTCPVIDSGVIGASSCAASGPSGGNDWTTTYCPGTATTGPTAVASCSGAIADSTNSWTATTCGTSTTTPVIVSSCTSSPPSAGNGFIGTNCTGVDGKQLNTTTYDRTQVFNVSGGVQASTGTDNTVVTGPAASGACYAPGSEPALPTNGPPSWTTADTNTYPSCSAWPCTVDVNTGNPRSVNSLADVAQYYYVTDLRTTANEPRGPDYYRDDVPGVGSGPEDDRVRWQHMTTFSIALGVNGTLRYKDDYKTSPTGDFAEIRTGPRNWPLWPDPAADYVNNPTLYNDPRSIDDFWHAAVNGRGTYFSAANPTSVIAGLAGALAGITSRVASSTGAGTSNLEPVAGDNFVYLANYTTQKWTGDVQAHEVDVATGIVQTPTLWSAQALLDAAVYAGCDNRRIFLFRAGAPDNLTNFSWGSKGCDVSGNPTGAADTGLNPAEQAYFNSTNVQFLSQWPTMTDGSGATPNQRADAAGANLVNYLRGQRGLENFTSGVANKLYRSRDHVLGDIVDGQPVYVRAPFGQYSDANFAAYKLAQAGRTPMLYVAANDGMLHAFYAGTSPTDPQGGKEAWAVVPSTMLPKLYKLADNNYKNIHDYFVDGTPTVSDVYDGSNWKTVLVGGLNDGGRGYYALDVTDPTSPKGMWEFNWSDTCYDSANAATFGGDCHLGLTFGKPLISKLTDGRWVVMVTSGYNNVNAVTKPGDGVGYLYVLNALTGQILYKISTGVGDMNTPSGLAQINNYVEKAEIDNTTVRVYGTDVVGNIWRFDVNNNTLPTPGREATLVATAKDSGGTPQPITTRPELTVVGGKPMLFVATGKLLGATDSSDVQTQSVYGIIDPVIGTTAFPNLRSSLAPLRMTQVGTGTGAYRTVRCTGTTAQCGSANGWVVDLPDTGERVNVEMKLRSQTLIIGSNVPIIGACSAGGYSWLNYLNFKSGLAIGPTGNPNLSVSTSVANSLIVGLTVIKLAGGTGNSDRIEGMVTTSNAGVLTIDIPNMTTQPAPKRISWREVLAQ